MTTDVLAGPLASQPATGLTAAGLFLERKEDGASRYAGFLPLSSPSKSSLNEKWQFPPASPYKMNDKLAKIDNAATAQDEG
ncbi:hypothetical protein [Bradyrhizobium betae]|uniref:hypothetical protein n=1 Tax=Bradyrhizobium betae TaxID=244734 RepID=UPI00100E5904|nr:hypothetical protein [Bradyrhizobium betae]